MELNAVSHRLKSTILSEHDKVQIKKTALFFDFTAARNEADKINDIKTKILLTSLEHTLANFIISARKYDTLKANKKNVINFHKHNLKLSEDLAVLSVKIINSPPGAFKQELVQLEEKSKKLFIDRKDFELKHLVFKTPTT
ncbi:hypothetical protein AAF463_24295 (plasmid) [Pantoea sp. BJ2]|uniref:Uncharacterized protein n=1 Tax=Pantoea sp. BJ2 TaxID=3141322 RepID=A0AAU7U2R6_9GAMM